jgi:hypothetical protein
MMKSSVGLVVLLLLLSACSPIRTHGCPGDKIGELDCSADVCRNSYDGEVFYRIFDEPTNVGELSGNIKLGHRRRLWFLSNTGRFKVYIGDPNNGYAYSFSKVNESWEATLEKDAYACTQ